MRYFKSFTSQKQQPQRISKSSVASLLESIKSCASSRDLHRTKQLHEQALETGFISNIFIANCLISTYAKCRCVRESRSVFEKMVVRDVVSWTGLMMGYVENGEAQIALHLLEEMTHHGISPNARTFVAALKACTSLGAKEEGMEIHSRVTSFGFDTDIFVASALVDMYSKCGSMVLAQRAFERSFPRDLTLWNTLVMGYVENGEPDIALETSSRMLDEGIQHDSYTVVAELKACTALGSRESKLMEIHILDRCMKHHIQYMDMFVASALVDLYAKWGGMGDARGIFDTMKEHDVVLWSTLIRGYTGNGEEELALELFEQMTCTPDALTYVAVLGACLSLAKKEQGEYTPWGCSMGFSVECMAFNGKDISGLQRKGVFKYKALEKGMDIHSRAIKLGFITDIRVVSTLVSMYAECGSMYDARRVFDQSPVQTIVLLNALMMGYVENGESSLALEIYQVMQVSPNSQTYLAALKACGSVTYVEVGKELHGYICKKGLETMEAISNSVLDLYGKCGSKTHAQFVFDSMPVMNSVGFTGLLASYSRDGNAECVLDILDRMFQEGFTPDGVTLVCVLAACSHAGLINTGKKLFQEMEMKYGVSPVLEHYHCMLDMLGRGNEIGAAMEMVKRMPFEADIVSWTTILAACSKWKNFEAGRVAYENLMRLNEEIKVESG